MENFTLEQLKHLRQLIEDEIKEMEKPIEDWSIAINPPIYPTTVAQEEHCAIADFFRQYPDAKSANIFCTCKLCSSNC
jgi:tRNA1(Val) A37 N6-methylase TrmN6